MTETGFIYKLCCLNPEIKDVYVGSTKNVRTRKFAHKTSCLNANDKKYNLRVYKFIRENGSWDNWDMIIIEEYKYNTKHELQSRERYWLETLQASLNCLLPIRTKKEYRKDNSELIAEKAKEYYENNKEKAKEYYENNKEKAKEYYENNKDKILERQKKYDVKNKEQILGKASQKIICECGSCFRKDALAKHKKTTKHQFYETTYNYIYS